jgi:hypothetical protein
VRPLRDVRETADHTTARDFARGVVFVTRAAAVWTSFCTFRAAGRLARDVPAIREALA